MITVTLPKTDMHNSRHHYPTKEQYRAYAVLVNTGFLVCKPVTLRLYCSRSNRSGRIYASIWVIGKYSYNSGTGMDGGTGYDKASAAIQKAIESAGLTLSASLNGDGEVREALIAIARALYPQKRAIITIVEL